MSTIARIRPFRFETDRFAFANESTWNDNEGASVYESGRPTDKKRIYSKRCFVMARSAFQFWKFARFEPGLAAFRPDGVVSRIRRLRGTDPAQPPWPDAQRIVFGGSATLLEFSRCHAPELRRHLGPGWTTYVRPANLRMACFPTRGRQHRLFLDLQATLDEDAAVPLWLFTFPHFLLTHSVVAYEWSAPGDGRIVFSVYDPNYKSHPKRLVYHPDEQRFHYQRTYFFAGGKIDVAPIYRLERRTRIAGSRSPDLGAADSGVSA